jgi:hypothetical protein
MAPSRQQQGAKGFKLRKYGSISKYMLCTKDQSSIPVITLIDKLDPRLQEQSTLEGSSEITHLHNTLEDSSEILPLEEDSELCNTEASSINYNLHRSYYGVIVYCDNNITSRQQVCIMRDFKLRPVIETRLEEIELETEARMQFVSVSLLVKEFSTGPYLVTSCSMCMSSNNLMHYYQGNWDSVPMTDELLLTAVTL